ncbi:hypothetical protein AB1Y20_003537 [Prymnesium parvum]|uniref:Branched-chain-amino-acid transaminase n=1 Tax=Prymnesium parvum TaxID=97485 RepID=A0AB34J4Z7_PRYPA
MRLPVLRPSEALERLRSHIPPRTASSVFAFYSSALGGIVTDPSLATVPVDDHAFHRGHAVFDTCHVSAGKAFNLSMHLDRLLSSARQARILPALDEQLPPAFTKEALRQTVLQTIAATGRREGVYVRYWCSAGRGDFSISPARCEGPSFFCVAHEDMHSAALPRGLKAVTVGVPLKPPLLATMKSNNYLLNALVAMEAEAAGANLGIQIDEEGNLAESSVSAIGIVDTHGVLRSPPADSILHSTSWRRAHALSSRLVERGLLSSSRVAPISASELRDATEVLSFGGGWVEPIVRLDGKAVGSGEAGPVFSALDELIRADFYNPELTDDVPYE